MERSTAALLALHKLQLRGLRHHLDALNPRATLARGYAVVRRADGSVVLSPSAVVDGETLLVELRDGVLNVRVADHRDPAP
jgi:exodeoxyribonuclease VII large subunit